MWTTRVIGVQRQGRAGERQRARFVFRQPPIQPGQQGGGVLWLSAQDPALLLPVSAPRLAMEGRL
eukprot:1013737-Prorocentrum_lima.AAC.1